MAAEDTHYIVEELSGAANIETRLNELRTLKNDPFKIIGSGTILFFKTAIKFRVPKNSYGNGLTIRHSITSDIDFS